MKKVLFILAFAVITACTQNAPAESQEYDKSEQENSEQVQSTKTKIEAYESTKGAILKFRSYNLKNIKNQYTTAKASIREIFAPEKNGYFYEIETTGSYGSSSSVFIAFEDLQEVLKAYDELVLREPEDIATQPDYLENKYVTVDGFKMGYYVEKASSQWFMSIDSRTSLFLTKEEIKRALDEAMAKMIELNAN